MEITTQQKTIRPGYKQTEVGVIPSDWDVKKLGNATDVIMGQSPAGSSYNREGFGAPLINGPTEFTKKYPIKIQWTSQPTKMCKNGDVLLCVRGSSTGRINISDDVYCIGRGIAAIRARSEFDQKFITFQIDSAVRGILLLTTGSTFPNIDRKTIRAIEFPAPPTKTEQSSIASVLSDTDALIASIEKLISKKRDIKQGVMQKLLTGKRRLPGFSGEWQVKEMGEIGKPYGGLSGKIKSDFGTGNSVYIPFMNIMSNPVIDPGYLDLVNIRTGEYQNKAQKGDLFFNGSSETPEEVGMCSVLLTEIPNLYLNSFCFGFRLNPDLNTDGLFFSYYFRSSVGRQLIFSLAQGATRYNLSKTNFLKLKVPYPKPEEQTAIATVLSDMDAEIGKLESQLTKYQNLKQGMMQVLLTGKIRLLSN